MRRERIDNCSNLPTATSPESEIVCKDRFESLANRASGVCPIFAARTGKVSGAQFLLNPRKFCRDFKRIFCERSRAIRAMPGGWRDPAQSLRCGFSWFSATTGQFWASVSSRQFSISVLGGLRLGSNPLRPVRLDDHRVGGEGPRRFSVFTPPTLGASTKRQPIT
jgi:hypothetical protein